MVSKVKTYFKEGFNYTGLEISETEQGEVFFLLELKQRKNELVITNKKELRSLTELSTVLPKNNPIFLCINTDQVLTKIIQTTNNTNTEALVNHAFPNLDIHDFYYEVIQEETGPVVTISRKEHVDSILKRLKELKVNVFKFSLGVATIGNITPFLQEKLLMVSNYQIDVHNNLINTITHTEDENLQLYNINGLELSNAYVLAFSNILANLNQSASRTNFVEVTKNLKSEFKNKRTFDHVLKIALSFFILLLLGNFLIYNSFHEKIGILNTTLETTNSQKDALSQLDATVSRKQERVEILSSSSNSKVTYYLDLFAQKLPNSILLNEIKYQPLAKPVREKKPILLDNGILLVSGISKDVNQFSFWVEELEKYDWINAVETLDYDHISKNTSNFLIEIGFHED